MTGAQFDLLLPYFESAFDKRNVARPFPRNLNRSFRPLQVLGRG